MPEWIQGDQVTFPTTAIGGVHYHVFASVSTQWQKLQRVSDGKIRVIRRKPGVPYEVLVRCAYELSDEAAEVELAYVRQWYADLAEDDGEVDDE